MALNLRRSGAASRPVAHWRRGGVGATVVRREAKGEEGR